MLPVWVLSRQSIGHTGGLTNPCPGVENVEPVIANTGGPPIPRKRAPSKKSKNLSVLDLEVKYISSSPIFVRCIQWVKVFFP